MKTKTIMAVCLLTILTSCTENYSRGERVGMITQFSQAGLIFNTWEGHLNMTQTGSNTAAGWDFSLDSDEDNSALESVIDSACTNGWKVKLKYHITMGKNWFKN